MTARATFTQADLQRAIRAATKEGAVVRVVKTADGPALEFLPATATLTGAADAPKVVPEPHNTPGQW